MSHMLSKGVVRELSKRTVENTRVFFNVLDSYC